MLKATREAKQQTSWTLNNAEFESALDLFIDAALQHQAFIADVAIFVDRIRDAGRINSLAQTLMKHTVPGVPDLYQGGELWDLSLVDPDNRRPVDLAARRDRLRTITDATASALVGDLDAMKLLTIRRVLGLRRKHPSRFSARAPGVCLHAWRRSRDDHASSHGAR